MDNINLFFTIHNLSGKSQIMDNLMVFTTNYIIYLSFVGVLAIAFWGKLKEKKALGLILLAIPVSFIIIKLIHIFIYEPRPFVTFHFTPLADNKADASFPSHHATIMAVIAFAYTFLKSKWALPFLGLMILVSFSRIYVGVHYPLDILGGLIVGILSLAISSLLWAKFLRAKI